MDAPNRLKYFLYARKSTESDDRQAASIDDQIAEMQRLAQRLNLNVVDIIRESQSAKKPGRVEFNKMIERTHNGEANAILCWRLNRLARNPIDGGQIWPAPGSEDTELGVLMELEVGHGETEVYPRVQA